MSQPRVYRTEAVVLKGVDFGETDKVLTLYTLHQGKLRVVAKGVRRPGSRLGGHLDILTHSQLLLAHGRNLDIVTQAETIDRSWACATTSGGPASATSSRSCSSA